MLWTTSKSFASAILCLAALPASAQTPAPGPKFEVASVHLISTLDQTSAAKIPAATVTYSGARVNIAGFTIKSIIATAYRTETYLVTSPDWTAQTRVIIQALMPQGATKDQLPEMMKSLLIERFHLATHTTTLDEPVYALVKGKNGPKLNPPRDLDQATCAGWTDKSGFDDFQGCNKTGGESAGTSVRTQMSVGGPNGPTRFEMSLDGDLVEVREEYLRMTMPQLARRMSVPCAGSCLNLPVVDRTGITGAWDFSLNRTCSGPNCDTYASTLEKIGLKVEKTVAPVERLVIDQIDKAPAEN